MKVFFDTLGCPKNLIDTDNVKGFLKEKGYEIATSVEDAQVVIVNTCGFVNDAKEESIDTILEYISVKNQQNIKVIATGCLTQKYGEEIKEEIPELDYVIGVNDYNHLDKVIQELTEIGKEEGVKATLEEAQLDDWSMAEYREVEKNQSSAYLKIAEGCNNCCTYCVIPEIRGPFRSRPKEAILKEANRLSKEGCKELILVAQDVTGYGIDLYGTYLLPELLASLSQIESIEWIRLMYCYTDKMTPELIQAMAQQKKVCHYIDMPIQHINDTILGEMNRLSRRAEIEGVISSLRKSIPDIHIRTTVIVGFPGETEEQFNELLEFVKTIKFERLGVFAYSQEPGTKAGGMDNQISGEIKEERRNLIMEAQRAISLEKNQEKIGKTYQVMIEETEIDSYIGRTEYDSPEIDNTVIFTSEKPHNLGDMVMVEIIDAFDYDLVGIVVESE